MVKETDMKNVNRVTALIASVGITAAAMMPTLPLSATAAEESEIYTWTYSEDFNNSIEDVFGDNGLFEYGQNADETTVTLEEHAQGGSYLKAASDGRDVQVNTKKGVFKHDMTVVDMWLSADSVSPFPQIKLICGGQKLGKNQANGILAFTGGQQWRAYDINTPSDYMTYNSGNKWIPVRIILDSKNKSVTINVYGSQMTKTTELEEAWDNSEAQLNFQAASGSAVMVDDVTISDGTYMADVYMDYNFEHSSVINGEINSNFFYGINKVNNPEVVYDEATQNTYLDIANDAGNTIYTNNTFDLSAGRPIVIEYSMRTDETSNVNVIFRKSSSLVPNLFNITGGILTEGTRVLDVSDGRFHTYRAVFTPGASGYSISKLVDGNWIGTAQSGSGDYTGTGARIDLRPSSGMCAIDNFKIFVPQQPQLMCELDGRDDIPVDSVIELVSNTRINASTASKAKITANGEETAFTASSDGARNSYIFDINGGLQPDTEYIITTGENGIRDFYDQFYNTSISFKTGSGDAAHTEQPSSETEQPTELPTEQPAIPTAVPTIMPQTYSEDFNNSIDDVFGDNGLFEYGQNADETTVTLEEHAQGGSYLKAASDGRDVQVNTKKGVFKHDMTVVDMWLSADSVSPFPQIKLICGGQKLGKNQANGILAFTGGQQWRAYDINTPSDYMTYNSGNKWIPVRIILDSKNKSVTINVYGSQMTKTTELEEAWDNSEAQLNFQAASGSAVMVDDVTISDGTYMADVYMDYNFEHSSVINGEINSNFFYGINKVNNPEVVYDEATQNTYLDIANDAGNTIYTNNTFDLSAGRPIVIEYSMRTDETSNVNVIFRKSSSLVPVLFTIESGIVKDGAGDVDVSDGALHSYCAVFTAKENGEGYSVLKLVDGEIISAEQKTEGDYTGTGARFDFRPSAGMCEIDDLKIFIPADAPEAAPIEPTEEPEPTQIPEPTEAPQESVEVTTVCKINGEEINDGKLISGTLECVFNAESDVAAGVTVKCYIAQYDEHGSIIKLQVTDIAFTDVGKKTKRAIASVSNAADKVGIFTWRENQIPVGQKTELVR